MKVDIIVCEADSYDLGGASCIVLDTEKLAISDAVTRTGGPKLYQSSRQSSGSLRFSGLSLENGLHNVNLSFAETVVGDQGSQKWMSLGKRVFDIYIQGILQLKDFDISREVGTCCIPDQGSYGPLISALKCHSRHTEFVYLDFTPTVGIGRKKKKSGLLVGIAVALGSLGLRLVFLILHMRIKRDNDDAEVLLGIGPKLKNFSYAELRSATEDFDRPNMLGQGGFGPV
ncbi:hypothetical protein Pint_11499 [Pistacia integerrima]|uniref:Uncharacterized protein n=1 Tax=Pistacia integerrima TaxID=434235 RepID=A0ACC0XG11_9ROSI|nr:hypothetical protein Pint_11499 [Pistacia integerrima]